MANFTQYQTLTLNGITYSKTALLALSKKTLNRANTATWEKSLFRFIQIWLDETDFVSVNTSGSTGKPKTIRLEKDKMVASAKATGAYFQLRQPTNALLCLPCDYIAGKMMVVRSFVLGMNLLTVAPSRSPLAAITDSIDFVAMIPMQVMTSLERHFDQLNQIKQIIIGGGAVNNTLHQQLQTIQPVCYATYGMTETITHIAVKQLNTAEAMTTYQALKGVQFSKDTRGCLVIDAPRVASQKIITNDIVRLDSPQRFEWLGRHDNVINTGGIKVYPEQIEKKLATFISNRFFIGALPDKKLGSRVVLIIEDKGQKTHELQAIFKNILSKYEIPKAVYFQPQFIETPTGKIQRQATLKLLGQKING